MNANGTGSYNPQPGEEPFDFAKTPPPANDGVKNKKEEDERPKAPPPWEARVRVVSSEWYTEQPPPRRWLLRDARTPGRDGVFPMGKVGLIAAEGGAGKTMAVTHLTISVTSGEPWLGAFEVPEPGKVLLALGEEDEEEVRRRIYRARQVVSADPPEGSVVTLPLAGVSSPLVTEDGEGDFLVWLRDYLVRTGPYSLVVLDPIARFCGEDTEKDNAAATRFVTAMESLIVPSGGGSILGSHHTNQNSRGNGGKVDAVAVRGVSALVDGSRWVSTLRVERYDDQEATITLAMAKSNYSMFASPVSLRYGEGGVLVPLTDEEQNEAEEAREAASPAAKKRAKADEAKADKERKDIETVAAIVQEQPGVLADALRTVVKARCTCGSPRADVLVQLAVDAGRIRREEISARKVHHYPTGNGEDS